MPFEIKFSLPEKVHSCLKTIEKYHEQELIRNKENLKFLETEFNKQTEKMVKEENRKLLKQVDEKNLLEETIDLLKIAFT